MGVDAEWKPWVLGKYRSDSIGGHAFCLSPVATRDHRVKAEKAFLATGKCQVVHHHSTDDNCDNNPCEIFGVNCPTIHTPKVNGQGELEI